MALKADRLFIFAGLLFAGAGLLLGEQMGRSGNHMQMPTHAHIMLVGWVFPALYGLIYRAYPALTKGALSYVHFLAHMAGAISLAIGLFYVFGGHPESGFVVPLLAGGAGLVILGWLLFLFLFILRSGKDVSAS
ncbi:MAG: TonB-dependent receptor [Alphaproteobacteria bacterium]|nr:TonB-dependent receptor [Alphaproteobacteria bacterium]